MACGFRIISFLQTLLQSLRDNIAVLEHEIDLHDLGTPQVWDSEASTKFDDPENLISWQAYEANEKIRVDVRALDAAVTPNHIKLLEMGLQPARKSALNVAVSLGITDAITDLGGDAKLAGLASRLNVNEQKSGRVMRTLAAEYIYQKKQPNVFSNTRHNTKTKDSYLATDAPFCSTVAQNGETFFEYIGHPENSGVALKVIKGVLPWLNRTTRPALLNHYPWHESPRARVVDVGCGPGDSSFDIMRHNPELHWTFQDLQPAIESLKTNLPEDIAQRAADGKVNCVVQDYFKDNAAEGDIWYLRGVLREYDDEDAIKILTKVANFMRKTPDSRKVINEIWNSSPFNVSNQNAAPSTLTPTHQSRLSDLANLMTWDTLFFFCGKERSVPELESILEKAGLRISRFFHFRTITTMVECSLA
ncbi:S-adenosyl-L-methionine-dependent methyltransferase [Colletotrichum phormii]|uniref:S-adenosyl-L-methionine-dependent methyltransferase n=1 Tax=Colletotrichum phormii TaxID=359342 RepID=A0AAI9ZBH3_9PEZI|nr:S-adenosyl-L-methionine-dependent methyltransferase [Colletotrichum phormii]KAK1621458.1 S-adenosyl-L-methionine-dependent methyltransferase [Colletotrichum phormii]